MSTTKTDRKNRDFVTSVFRDRYHAQAAIDWLNARGYTRDEIDVMVSENSHANYALTSEGKKIEAGSKLEEGAATGGAIGTAIGATLGAILAIGTSVAIPGLGLVVAGPIVAGLAGAGAGAISGGLLGGLIGLGIPESDAKAYETALKEGGVALGVLAHNDDDTSKIKEYFSNNHGENVVVAARS